MRKNLGQSIYDKLNTLYQILKNIKKEEGHIAHSFDVDEQIDILTKDGNGPLNWFQDNTHYDDMKELLNGYNSHHSTELYKLMRNSNSVWEAIPAKYKDPIPA